MTLRGKDYCNCEHAKFLHEAITKALTAILDDNDFPGGIDILLESLEKDVEAYKDYSELDEACLPNLKERC